MRGADRRHAVGVAREVERSLGAEASRPVLAAALLHDVGKIESGLGVYGRVIATLCGMIAGRETPRNGPEPAASPAESASTSCIRISAATCSGWRAAIRSPRRGRGNIIGPPDSWTIDPEIAVALKAADDD